MGILGVVRTENNPIDAPIHECCELWFNPEFPDRAMWWSWKLNLPDPLTDDSPWRLGLDLFVGHHVVYKRGDTKAVWQIVKADHRAGLLLGRWPD